MKNKKVVIAVFTVIYTIIVSLGVACLLGAFFAAVGASMDYANPWKAYPYYMPFCVITGLVALIIFITAIVWNIIIVEKNDLQSKGWIIEFICPTVLLIPMLYVWDIVFGILGKIF